MEHSQSGLSAGEYLIVDGRTYSIALAAIARGLLVREDYLQEAGVDYREIRTWDDLLDAAVRATKLPLYSYGYTAEPGPGVGRLRLAARLRPHRQRPYLDAARRAAGYFLSRSFAPYGALRVRWDFGDPDRAVPTEQMGGGHRRTGPVLAGAPPPPTPASSWSSRGRSCSGTTRSTTGC